MSSPTQFRADLHCHTTCSDGSLTPKELVAHAKAVGLSALSITDHDTVAAYEEALPAAEKIGLILGTGIEFSSQEGDLSVHILGYNFILYHPEILRLCAEHRDRRLERNRAILAKLKAKKMPLEEDFLHEGFVVGRAHIAAKMLEKGYVKSISEAFNRFIGDSKPCFSAGHPITVDETLRVIHAAKGKAFIAHPHLLPAGSKLKKLLDKPFDGVECYYSRFFPHQEKQWLKLAGERKLLISGGSDFHGAVRPDVALGCSWVDQETFNKIFDVKHY